MVLLDLVSQMTLLLVGMVFGVVLERSGWLVRLNYVFNYVLNIVFNSHSRKGFCSLVGSGPGDPELLTIGARKAIMQADIVIADLLVSKDILKLVKGELVMSRKYKGCANKAQDELHEWCLKAMRNGLNVVRLKGGDPFVYGRGAEEIEIFKKEGFDVKVYPGISSCLSAPLSAGIAVTTRRVADQLLICTGHGMNDTIPKEISPYYIGRTTIYLMSVSRMTSLMEKLQEPHIGYPGSVPVAVIEKATTKDQRVVRGTVDTIAKIAQLEQVSSPATIVIGRAVDNLYDSRIEPEYVQGGVLFKSPVHHLVQQA